MRLSHHVLQGYHVSGISGNLEISENLAKVRENLGKGRGSCVVREIIWLWLLNKITYLYFIRTVIHFSYVMFAVNLD